MIRKCILRERATEYFLYMSLIRGKLPNSSNMNYTGTGSAPSFLRAACTSSAYAKSTSMDTKKSKTRV